MTLIQSVGSFTLWIWAVLPTFWRYVLPPCLKSKSSIIEVSVVHAASNLRVDVDPKDGGNMHLRNVDNAFHIHMV
jgi:hypothetical protein